MFSRVSMFVASAVLGTTGVIVPATSASALPVICNPGEVWWDHTQNSAYALTHVTGYQMPPGGSLTITKSAGFEAQLSSSASVTAGVSVSASTVIAKMDASVSGTLAAAGSTTTTNNVSVTASIAAANSDRYYAAYAGKVRWWGTWQRNTCNSNGTYISVSKGNWRSWTVGLEGIALCPSTRYSYSSLPAKACRLTWG